MSEPLSKYHLNLLTDYATRNIAEDAHHKARLRALLAEREAQTKELETLRQRVVELESANSDVRTRIRQLERLTVDAMSHVSAGTHNPLWKLVKAYREMYGVDLITKPETEGE